MDEDQGNDVASYLKLLELRTLQIAKDAAVSLPETDARTRARDRFLTGIYERFDKELL